MCVTALGAARGAAADAHRAESSRKDRQRAALVGTFAALIFAAHPLATQAVTYLIQRTAALAALLELGAVVLWLLARERGGRLPWGGSIACATLAAFTKEMSVALPILIAMLEALLPDPDRAPAIRNNEGGARDGGPGDARGRARFARIRRVAPYFVVWVVLLSTMSLPTAHRVAGVAGFRETTDISRSVYLTTELTVLPRYLLLFFWPRGQSLDPAVPLHVRADAA